MLPAHGPLSVAWIIQWSILWGSWLVWPLLGWLVWRMVREARSTSRRQWPRRAAVFVLVLWFVEMRFIEPALIVERHTVLNLGFQARLALISDYHVGLYNGPAFLDRVVDRLNAMPLDGVLIAGDHLSKPDRPLSEVLAPLARLRHPAFSVPGNHDESFPGPPVVGIASALRRRGASGTQWLSRQRQTLTAPSLESNDRFIFLLLAVRRP